MAENFDSFLFTGDDGLMLKGFHWQPTIEYPMGIIILVHGMGEHVMRYAEFIHSLQSSGFIVYGMDLRGHGDSEGKRGHARGTNYIDDLENLMKIARAEFNDLPMILYGHSTGGNIALNYLLKKKTREISAVILSAPWLQLHDQPNKLVIMLVKFISKLIPFMRVPFKITPDQLTSDAEKMKEIEKDPKLFRKISVSNFYGLDISGKWNIRNAYKLKTPCLLMHGTKDTVTSYQASQKIAQEADHVIEFKSWESSKHELHQDRDRKKIMDFVKNWIFKILDQKSESLNFYS